MKSRFYYIFKGNHQVSVYNPEIPDMSLLIYRNDEPDVYEYALEIGVDHTRSHFTYKGIEYTAIYNELANDNVMGLQTLMWLGDQETRVSRQASQSSKIV
jgi:hypothetical protein